jgi:hypothetical protein
MVTTRVMMHCSYSISHPLFLGQLSSRNEGGASYKIKSTHRSVRNLIERNVWCQWMLLHDWVTMYNTLTQIFFELHSLVRLHKNTFSLSDASSHEQSQSAHENDLHPKHTKEAKLQNRMLNFHNLRNHECWLRDWGNLRWHWSFTSISLQM